MTEANCPKCKYDLRSHLGPPMPQMVRCPECGGDWSTIEFRQPSARRRLPLLRYTFVPMPVLILSLTLVFMMIGDPGIFIILLWFPVGFFIISLIHASVIGHIVVMDLDDDPSIWKKFGVGCAWFGLILIYDVVCVACLVHLTWNGFRM